MVVRAGYVGTDARQMAFPFNINQPTPSAEPYINKSRPFPTMANITEQRNLASHTYHALNLALERRMYRGLLYQSTLTIAKDVGNDGVTPENTFDLVRERGMMQLLPHRRWVSFLVYELPFGKGKPILGNASNILDHIVGGWQISGIIQAQTGTSMAPPQQTQPSASS